MRRTISCLGLCGLSLFFLLGACNKQSLHTASTTDSTTSTTATSATIAVAVDSAGTDSVYILQSCAGGLFRDSIAASALPAVTSAYVDSNYNGFSYISSFVIKDSAGTTNGYVVIIRYNGLPVGLLFDASGAFTRVLEQREGGDMRGSGWHHDGRYGNRDGRQRDTVSISALPAAALSYFSGTQPGDTLVKAYRNIDSSYLVLSTDNGLFATLFSKTGVLIRRVSLAADLQTVAAVASANLPAAALSYLSATYPDYVFGKGFVYATNGMVTGYLVVIDASNTKYAITFDAAGKETGAITLW